MWFLRGSAPSEDDPEKPYICNPVDTRGIACCPVAVKPCRDTRSNVHEAIESVFESWRVSYTVGSALEAWEIFRPGPPFAGSYGFNQTLLQAGFGSPGPIVPTAMGPDLFGLRGGHHIPVLLDCALPYARPGEGDIPPPKPSAFGVSEMSRFCIDRHDRCVNGLFLDGSVRRIGLKELWTLKWHGSFNTANRWTTAGGVQPGDWPEWMRGFKDY